MSILQNPTAWVEGLISSTAESAVAFLPNLVGALGILLLGWLGGLLVRWTLLRFGTGLDALMATLYRRTGRAPIHTPWNVSRVVATLAFWTVLLLVFTAASDTLGLKALAQWLRDLAFYLPRLLIAGLTLFLGYRIGRWRASFLAWAHKACCHQQADHFFPFVFLPHLWHHLNTHHLALLQVQRLQWAQNSLLVQCRHSFHLRSPHPTHVSRIIIPQIPCYHTTRHPQPLQSEPV